MKGVLLGTLVLGGRRNGFCDGFFFEDGRRGFLPEPPALAFG